MRMSATEYGEGCPKELKILFDFERMSALVKDGPRVSTAARASQYYMRCIGRTQSRIFACTHRNGGGLGHNFPS